MSIDHVSSYKAHRCASHLHGGRASIICTIVGGLVLVGGLMFPPVHYHSYQSQVRVDLSCCAL